MIRAGEGPLPPNAQWDLYLITAEPGEPRRSDSHVPGVVEHVVQALVQALVRGTVAVMVSEHR